MGTRSQDWLFSVISLVMSKRHKLTTRTACFSFLFVFLCAFSLWSLAKRVFRLFAGWQYVHAFRLPTGGGEGAQEAVRAAMDAGGEVEDVRVCVAAAVAEGECPEAIVDDREPERIVHQAHEPPGDGMKRGDPAAAGTEIADKNVVGEWPEARRRNGHAPGSIHPPARLEALEQNTSGRENVHEAQAGSRVEITAGVGDEELAADILDVERRVGGGDIRIVEGAQ